MPHTFVGLNKQIIASFPNVAIRYDDVHQLLEADIVYIRNFMRPETLDDEQLKHLAIIAHYCYRSFDMAAYCCQVLARRSLLPSSAVRHYATLVPR